MIIKKKIVLSIITILGLFIITGCTNKETSTKEQTNEKSSKSEITIGSSSVALDYSSSFNSINFKYPSTASYSNTGSYCIIDSMDDGDLLVRVAMSYYPGKTIGEVIGGSNLSSYDALEYNGNTWNVYHGTQEDGKKIKNYITIINEDAYSIAFISDKDTNAFEETFMNNVK